MVLLHEPQQVEDLGLDRGCEVVPVHPSHLPQAPERTVGLVSHAQRGGSGTGGTGCAPWRAACAAKLGVVLHRTRAPPATRPRTGWVAFRL